MTDIEREGRDRLYRDTGKARYVTRSESLIPAIIAKHRLSVIDIVVFGKIADYFDSRSGEPYVASCGDISKYLKDAFTRSGIAKSIKT
ncbi:MAG: hypothetical protein LBF62_12920, partial [Tannerellaceae bacterium]|nr:hypothetical protein [Tannerellaceae bacterium]